MDHHDLSYYRRILKYWAKIENYFVPEWRGGPDGSQPALCWQRDWPTIWQRYRAFEQDQDRREQEAAAKKRKFERRRFALLIHLQCHTGMYLLDGDPHAAYKRPPRTCVVSFLLNFASQPAPDRAPAIGFSDMHWAFNRILLEELTQDPNLDQRNLPLRNGIETLQENLTTEWAKGMEPAPEAEPAGFDSDQFGRQVKQALSALNRVVLLLWSKNGRNADFMAKNGCTELTLHEDCSTKAGDFLIDNNGNVNFSWRWMITDDSLKPDYMGPFFDCDLAHLVDAAALSPCIKTLLSPPTEGVVIPQPVAQDPEQVQSLLHPAEMNLARWPTPPQFGLVLMQQLAIHTSCGRLSEETPLLAVNGPPGTGKTTLVKDFIAEQFVQRSLKLADQGQTKDWFAYRAGSAFPALEAVLEHAVIVASANNKAVENISRELPQRGGIDPALASQLAYFPEIAQAETWGPFCAVLGNAKNRNRFEAEVIQKLKDHLARISEPLQLAKFANTFSKHGTKFSYEATFQHWVKSEHFSAMIAQLQTDQTGAGLAALLSIGAASGGGWSAVDDFLADLDEAARKALIALLKKMAADHRRDADRRATAAFEQARDQLQAAFGAVTAYRDQCVAYWNKSVAVSKFQSRLAAIKAELKTLAVPRRYAATDPEQVLRDYDQKEAAYQQCVGDLASCRDRLAQARARVVGLEDAKQTFVTLPWWRRFLHKGPWMFSFVSQTDEEIARFRDQIKALQSQTAQLDDGIQVEAAALAAAADHLPYLRCQAEVQKIQRKIRKLSEEMKHIATALAFPDDESVYLTQARHWRPLSRDEDAQALEERLQCAMPWGLPHLNRLRAELFVAAVTFNQRLIELSAGKIQWALDQVPEVLAGRAPGQADAAEMRAWWSLVLLICPVISTTFASVQRQFAAFTEVGGFGTLVVDEAGQAIKYHALGLLQRCRRALIVGDPQQLEPVVTVSPFFDRKQAASVFGPVDAALVRPWLVSEGSLQDLADRVSPLKGFIGVVPVGLPLRVHRRCQAPMFEIANQIAYAGTMISAVAPNTQAFPASAWFDIQTACVAKIGKYYNPGEIEQVLVLVDALLADGTEADELFILTPFRLMCNELKAALRVWSQKADDVLPAGFFDNNVGTVHTFQGKEAQIVILCLVCDPDHAQGTVFVQSKPNLLNVAVTRAKKTLLVIGNHDVWRATGLGRVICERLHVGAGQV